MANILQFPGKENAQTGAERYGRLLECFSAYRRTREDVFWLKENAELLNILECTGIGAADLPKIADSRLAALTSLYQDAARQLSFFRQYYRFHLSICMDLEDLGLVKTGAGSAGALDGEGMARWVSEQGLPGQELSDLQRAEAQRLLARRNIGCPFPGLDGRLHHFIEGAENFALPNRKAAYELTHILFYLSDYGRRDPGVAPRAVQSLINAGLVAYLDRDADLLAEVCIALRYAGETPPSGWEGWLNRHCRGFAIHAVDASRAPVPQQDDYHMFLVCNWHQAVSGGRAFAQHVPQGALHLQQPRQNGILGALSQAVFAAGSASADWEILRSQIAAALSEEDYQILTEVEASAPDFGAFFESFARAGLAEPGVRREAQA